MTSSARASSVRGTVEAEHSGGLGIDDQLELRRLHYRQVCGLGALEDATDIDANLMSCIRDARSVADQPADFGRQPLRIYCRDCVACRQLGQLDTAGGEEGAGGNEEGVGWLSRKTCEGRMISRLVPASRT